MMFSRQTPRLCALCVAAVLAMAGCTGYEPEPGSTSAPNSAQTSSEGTGSTSTSSAKPSPGKRTRTSPPAREVYSWGLPPSDTSIAGNDGPAYAQLQISCAAGQAYLDRVAPDGYGFRSPLNVVLFAAGLRLCFGDRPGAQSLYDHGVNRYGLSGLPEGKPECELYKSVRSVLDQVSRTSFPCPGGLPPQDIFGPTGLLDDPLTIDIDESLPQETETTGTAEAPETTEATDAPATEATEQATSEPATPTP